MATIETAIVERLRTSALVNGLVQTRISPWEGGQADVLPRITYFRVSSNREHHMLGSSGFAFANIQIDCWAEKYSTAKDLGEAVRRRLDGYRGTSAGHYVGHCHIIQDRDLPQRLSTGTEKSLYRILQEYRISFRETAGIVN